MSRMQIHQFRRFRQNSPCLAGDKNTGCRSFAYSWKLPLTVELFYLQSTILAFLLTAGAFLLTISPFWLTIGAFLLTVGKCV